MLYVKIDKYPKQTSSYLVVSKKNINLHKHSQSNYDDLYKLVTGSNF